MYQQSARTYKKYYNVLLMLITMLLFIVLINFFENKYEMKTPRHPGNAIKNTRFILLWNRFFDVDDFYFGFGSTPFHLHNCTYKDCFITNDRKLVHVSNFDSIVFHGPQFNIDDRPTSRSPHQKYVYLSYESPNNRPVGPELNGFFNLTATYRMDSDIYYPYFIITDMDENAVCTSRNSYWKEPIKDADVLGKYKNIFDRKKKPVAWFSSNCNAKNGREHIVAELQKYIPVDVYGACGPLKCPRSDKNACFNKLKEDYFFYLSFENSNCEDYLTEKVVNGLDNEAVPIVYGGANYSKFLPPHSYIDGRSLSLQDLANTMKSLMNDSSKYVEYFWWKDFYKVSTPPPAFCGLCEILHTKDYVKQSYDISEWWHGTKSEPKCVPYE